MLLAEDKKTSCWTSEKIEDCVKLVLDVGRKRSCGLQSYEQGIVILVVGYSLAIK